MNIKMRLYTIKGGFGPAPEEGEEVEQRLIIAADGRVWFTSYVANWTTFLSTKGIRHQFKTSPEIATSIIKKVDTYFATVDAIWHGCDTGSWDLELTTETGEVIKCSGDTGEYVLDNENLSKVIRQQLGMKFLYAFDCCCAEEEEDW